MKIAVFGGGDKPNERAEEFGRLAARHRHLVVTGGYGGVMESAAKGATEAGGQAIGIVLPALEKQPNPYLTEVFSAPGETVEEQFGSRLGLLLACNALVFFPGGTGTQIEFVSAINLTAKLAGLTKTIIVMRSAVINLVCLPTRDVAKTHYQVAKTPSHAICMINDLARG